MRLKDKSSSYVHWILLSIFFGYQFLLRSSLGTFTNEIRQTFHLDSEQFANLAVYTMIIYSILQIPFGILLDKFGIRRIILPSLMLCIIGQYIFTHTVSYRMALLGRVILGIGCVPGYIGIIKLVVECFQEKSSLFIGISSAFGVLAVAVCNPIIKWISLHYNTWLAGSNCMIYTGIILLITGYLLLHPKQTVAMAKTDANLGERIKSVLFNYKLYICALFIIGTNIIAMVFADLWAPSFLHTKYSLSELCAVSYTQLIYIGCIIGTLILCLLFNGINKILFGIRFSCLMMILVLSFLAYGKPSWPIFCLPISLFLLGVSGSADVLAFSCGASMSTPKTAGMSASLINSLGMIGEPILQWTMGKALKMNWDGTVNSSGLQLYSTANYESALGIFVKLTIVVLIIACCYRVEKHNQVMNPAS